MLFKKNVKTASKNVLFDFGSILMSIMLFGPLATIANTPSLLFQEGAIETQIEQQISNFLPEYDVAIEQIEVTSSFSLTPIQITFENAKITREDQQIILPKATLVLGMDGVFTGRLIQKMTLDDVKIISEGKSSWIENTAFKTERASDYYGNFLTQIENANLKKIIPKQIVVSLDEMHLKGIEDSNNKEVLITESRLEASFSSIDDIQALLSVKINQSGEFEGNFDFDLTTGLWQTTLNTQSIDIAPFLEYLPNNLGDNIIDGFFSGKINAEFEQVELKNADGHFELQQLNIKDTPQKYFSQQSLFQENVDINMFSGWFSYDANDQNIDLDNLVIDFSPELKLKASLDIKAFEVSDTVVSGTVETHDTLVPSLFSYFNGTLFEPINKLVSNYSETGVIDFASVSFSAKQDSQNNKIEWQKFQFDGQISDLTLKTTTPQYSLLQAKTVNQISASLDQQGQVEKLILNTAIIDAKIRLAASDRLVENISGNVDFVLNDKIIQKASARFAQPEKGEVLFKAEFVELEKAIEQFGEKAMQNYQKKNANVGPSVISALTFETEKFDADLLLEIWPENIAYKTRQWLLKRGKGGIFSDTKVKAFMALPIQYHRDLLWSQAINTQLIAIAGGWDWQNMEFTWADNSPVVQSVDLKARVFDNLLSIEILNGKMPELLLENGSLEFSPILAYGDINLARKLEIEATIDGSIPALKKLLEHPTVNKLPQPLKKLSNPNGSIVTKISTKSVFQNAKLKLDSIASIASLADVSFGNLPLGETLSNGKIELTLKENGEILLDGTGNISGVDSSFKGHQKADKTLQIVAKTQPSDYLSERVKEVTKIDISGSSQMRWLLNYNTEMRTGSVNITGDLKDSSLNLPLLNWTKLPGEVGDIELLVDIRDDFVRSIKIQQAEIGTLQATGIVYLDENSTVTKANITDFRMPGYDINDLIVTIAEDGSFDVVAEGGLIDTTFLRRTDGVNENRDISFDFSSARIQLVDDITLQGSLIGKIDRDGAGSAILNGTLLVSMAALIEEATIDAVFDKQHETLSGTGLIGGAEATLSYQSMPDDTSQLIIKSQNAGRTLLGLDILDTIRGGDLILTNNYQNKQFDNFTTDIHITNFSVIEAPRSIRMLSVLSLVGVYSLIEGDGTKFDVGVATIKTEGNRRILEQVRASGQALKFALAGEFDRETEELQVRGILAPLSLLSDLIGIIPFFSDMIIGQDRHGLLATQFEMSGQITDPVTTINPSSVIAPGLFRNLLSPKWLTEESGTRLQTPTEK